MKKITILMMLVCGISFAQEKKTELAKQEIVADSAKTEKNWDVNVDIMSRYLWRGQCWGGNYMAVQPYANYSPTEKLTLGVWGTYNFKNEYFYPDGETSYKGYQEVDIFATYQINKFMKAQVWWYYWPSVEPVDGISNKLFDFSAGCSNTIDAMLTFDFSEIWCPLTITASTFVAGADYRFEEVEVSDADGNVTTELINPKQNYTTYLEATYNFENLGYNISLTPVVGCVLNNQAAYYTAGDTDRVSFVNLGGKLSRSFDLGAGISMPIWLSYTHNGSINNSTDTFGRDFLVAGVTFSF